MARRLLSPRGRLLAAVALGLLAGALAWKQLRDAKQRMEDRYRLSAAVIARKYIPAGRPVTPDLVETAEVPDAFRQPTALVAAADLRPDPAAEPLRARVGILKGEQITRSKLYDRSAALGLAWSVPAGRTALSLRLAPEHAAAGLVRPGDRVNVYCTRRRSAEAPRARTDLLMAGVRVAAVGSRIWDPAAPLDQKEEAERLESDSILVTLLLTVREAALVSFAAENGRVSLALVSALDESPAGFAAIEAKDLRRTSLP